MTIDLNNPKAIIRLIWSWVIWAAGLSLTAIVLVTIATKYGFRVPYVPTMEPMQLAALCVAYYCVPKG